MADNFLERHREEYEIRKAAWLKKIHEVRQETEAPDTDATS